MQRNFYNYEIIKKVGEGTFGNVYKARDKLNNQIIALKIINRIKNNL